jgi:hypothetical protein
MTFAVQWPCKRETRLAAAGTGVRGSRPVGLGTFAKRKFGTYPSPDFQGKQLMKPLSLSYLQHMQRKNKKEIGRTVHYARTKSHRISTKTHVKLCNLTCSTTKYKRRICEISIYAREQVCPDAIVKKLSDRKSKCMPYVLHITHSLMNWCDPDTMPT